MGGIREGDHLFLRCKYTQQLWRNLFTSKASPGRKVRMAEWTKALDSSSGPPKRAWVQIPLLRFFTGYVIVVKASPGPLKLSEALKRF